MCLSESKALFLQPFVLHFDKTHSVGSCLILTIFYPPEIDVLVLFGSANLHMKTTLHKTSFFPLGTCQHSDQIFQRTFLTNYEEFLITCGCLSLKFLVEFFFFSFLFKIEPNFERYYHLFFFLNKTGDKTK